MKALKQLKTRVLKIYLEEAQEVEKVLEVGATA